MLIINADDYGESRGTSDRILLCFANGRISSATAMMFMEDSERSAVLAKERGMEVGLHLNLSDHFTGNPQNHYLKECHYRVSRFLVGNRFSSVIYNPSLRNDFEYTFRSQWEEFQELYGAPPSHVDGHRHKHLVFNALFGNIFPPGIRIRRNFHFGAGEKAWANRAFRFVMDWYLTRRYVSTDYFFSIQPLQDLNRIGRIMGLSRTAAVELMVHPERDAELSFLMSPEFSRRLDGIRKGSYSMLVSRFMNAEQ